MADSTYPDFYTLPSSPTVTCQDRFGLLDSPTLDVPFWSVLTALLNPPIHSLPSFISILESIAIELRGTSPPDYSTLQLILSERETSFLAAWPSIVRLALDMPRLFPSHQLPIIKEGGIARLELSRERVACLVVHQFLGTMSAPMWQEGFQNFEIWYQGEQVHERTPGIYLTAMLDYLESVSATSAFSDQDEWKITYELASLSGDSKLASGQADIDFDPEGHDTELGDIFLEPFCERSAEAEYLGTNGNAVVISANRFIGFGRSATQEEVFVGTTPEACPAVLVTPPLASHQMLVVRGCEAMVKTVGQGRQISLAGGHNLEADKHGVHKNMWRSRTMLFMDALELDSFDDEQYPDIKHANIKREFVKAIVGFGSGRYPRIYTGLWGCGAFGGDPGVKMVILWLAASIQGSALTVTYEAEREDFARSMLAFVDKTKDRRHRVSDLMQLLWTAEGNGLAKGTFLDWAMSRF
jgi:poly(ADP-ribose) glycohydrolase